MYLHRAAGAKDEPLGPSNYSEYDRARFDRPRWQAGKQAAKKKGKKKKYLFDFCSLPAGYLLKTRA